MWFIPGNKQDSTPQPNIPHHTTPSRANFKANLLDEGEREDATKESAERRVCLWTYFQKHTVFVAYAPHHALEEIGPEVRPTGCVCPLGLVSYTVPLPLEYLVYVLYVRGG